MAQERTKFQAVGLFFLCTLLAASLHLYANIYHFILYVPSLLMDCEFPRVGTASSFLLDPQCLKQIR